MRSQANLIRADLDSSDTSAQRCHGIIERGIARLALADKIAKAQHEEFRDMVRKAQPQAKERGPQRWWPGGPSPTKADIEGMMAARRAGKSLVQVAKEYGCSTATVVRRTDGWRDAK